MAIFKNPEYEVSGSVNNNNNKKKNPERRKMGCSEKTVPFRDIVLGI